jgi:hypothetical protein
VAERGGDRPDQVEPGHVVGPFAVGEVQPDDVETGLDHPAEDLTVAGGRAEGGDDLGTLCFQHRAGSLA